MDEAEFQRLRFQSLVRESEQAKGHLRAAQERLRHERFSETRGPVKVTLSGLGEVMELEIENVASETADCVVAAIRAASSVVAYHVDREMKRGVKQPR